MKGRNAEESRRREQQKLKREMVRPPGAGVRRGLKLLQGGVDPRGQLDESPVKARRLFSKGLHSETKTCEGKMLHLPNFDLFSCFIEPFNSNSAFSPSVRKSTTLSHPLKNWNSFKNGENYGGMSTYVTKLFFYSFNIFLPVRVLS